MEDDGPLLSIGELARRTGLPVRTVRFWSDTGVLPPAGRTSSGRRVYDAACVARLELVATLRDLGLGLPDVRRVVEDQVTVAEVAAVHLEALDAQLRTLRLRRTVLAAVVKRAADSKEMTMVNKLARLSAAERRQIIEDFTAEVFQGPEPSPVRAARWAAGWAAAPFLPDDPSPEQVDAWVEVAELAGDQDFRADRAVLAAHGHHQRLAAAIPVPDACLRMADRRAARPSVTARRPPAAARTATTAHQAGLTHSSELSHPGKPIPSRTCLRRKTAAQGRDRESYGWKIAAPRRGARRRCGASGGASARHPRRRSRRSLFSRSACPVDPASCSRWVRPGNVDHGMSAVVSLCGTGFAAELMSADGSLRVGVPAQMPRAIAKTA
jgi:DNA-binding transcriptional MerR regulator